MGRLLRLTDQVTVRAERQRAPADIPSDDRSIRKAARVVWSGRYLDVRERLQIADLLRLGCSLRRIAAELGRHPSTIKRELDRHPVPTYMSRRLSQRVGVEAVSLAKRAAGVS